MTPVRDLQDLCRGMTPSMADGVFVTQHFRFVFANPALPQMLGYEVLPQKLNFQTWQEHVHPDDRHRVLTTLQRQIALGEPFDMETTQMPVVLVIDDEMMKQLEEIVAFSLPQLKNHIEDGKNIYDFLEREMKIEPIGISPLYQKEGYVFLSFDKSKEVFVYRYKVNLFQNSIDTFKGIMMQLIQKVRRSILNTYEQIKLDLIKTNRELPNPATYSICCTQQIPMEESFVPISKRLLLKTVE